MNNLDAPNRGTLRKTVTSAGTAERLSSTRRWCQYVTIQAETDNSDYVAIGDSNVVAADPNERGSVLAPGASVTLYGVDLYLLYVDAASSGDGVTVEYGY
jgi:hypothetical protein